jgi:hypothetical protein
VAGGKRDRLPEQVLRAVSGGSTSFSAIGSLIKTQPTRVLAGLEQLRLLQRVQPITEPQTTKLSYYRIADNFLAFWLTVIEKHRAAIDQGLGKSILGVVVQEFDDFMGERWEEALRKHIVAMVSRGEIAEDVVAVGEYWNRQVGPQQDPCQLDLVAVTGRSKRVALIGEAKWAKKHDGARMLKGITTKASLAKLNLIEKPTWVLCARDEITNLPENCLPITAHDIFA